MDFPDVIGIRDQPYPDRAEHTSIGASVADPGWLAGVAGDRPAAVMADSLLMFLTEDQVRRAFRQIVDHFPTGELAFTTYSSLIKRRYRRRPPDSSGRSASPLEWTLDDAQDLERYDERLHLMELHSQVSTRLVAHTAVLPGDVRAHQGRPSWKDSGLVLRYQF